MKDYSKFSVNDFIHDDFFQKWVTKPDARSNAYWAEWLRNNPEKQHDITEAQTIIRHLRFTNNTLSNDEIAGLWSRIRSTESTEKITRPSHFKVWYSVAASIVVLAVSIYLFNAWNRESYLEYHTAYGETKTIILPDSSTVILNSNSTLRYSHGWESKPVRELWLEGEAYFSVVHMVNNQPFRVRTDEGIAVEVLGTTFNVYHRTEQTKVVLNTGKIRLHLPERAAADSITMAPGDFIEYKDKSFSKRIVNPAIYTAWTENKIILDHTSLRDMVEMMHDNYGIEIRVAADTLLSQTVSGSMPLDNAESIVNQIAEIFELKISKNKNKYLMYE